MLDALTVMYGPLYKAVLALAIGYLLGSISFSILVPRLKAGITDIRALGSGNAGATNVLRTQGKAMAILVLFGDIAKGVIGAWIGYLLAGALGGALGSAGAIVGHCFPIFFQFKGGKGVATGIATIMMVDPYVGLAAVLVFILTIILTKTVSLGSILGAASIYITVWIFKPELPLILYCLFGATLVIVRHRSNIHRIINGTEDRLDHFSERRSSS